ncbi:Non-canonical purine NTP phosphatase [Pseudovibrio axinellae]|uniref:Inosine/xanthosine triphosphatase n=1 Tax=Pseudovibrio axinellae TaxID=989403 RepID=A0A161VBN3_9HYPH|nr:inosine/xanthosine triphosphatase [Pseudovibrio axinellae]KZL16778.1 Non-canonical purine NTP phosphatase [Pseudovibrio axinellae]SEQ75006.1 inosine/xanthosine triphosphatase [Pseudovibrio axinellae]
MKVVVASQNPVKVNATLEAFQAQFPADEIELISQDVLSGVSDQPMSDEETRKGAMTRAENALGAHTDADFGVGLEGGICEVSGIAYTFAWMAVLSREGQISANRSMLLPLPDKVMALVRSGVELGHALDEIFGTQNIKQKGGAFGLLSGGRLTRTSIYVDTLFCALLPFRSPAFM